MDTELPYRPSLQAEELEKPFYAHSRDSLVSFPHSNTASKVWERD